MGKMKSKDARLRRKMRIRKKIRGTPERPRLSVFKTSKHIYVQIIDDVISRTLVEASSLSKEIRTKVEKKSGNKQGAAVVGEFIAKRALERDIKKVVFDRNGFLYHGRIKSLAESALEYGLEF